MNQSLLCQKAGLFLGRDSTGIPSAELRGLRYERQAESCLRVSCGNAGVVPEELSGLGVVICELARPRNLEL